MSIHCFTNFVHPYGTKFIDVLLPWNEPCHFVETFVDPERFQGTCYKAANWIYLGETLGLGKDATSRQPNRSIKHAYGYPLHRRFRNFLCR